MHAINQKGIPKEVNTIVILAIIPVLLIVVGFFVPLSWIGLGLAWFIGYVGFSLNLLITWLLLVLASDKGIIRKPRESSLKWAKIIIIVLLALLIVMIISSVMVQAVPLEVSVMALIIMAAFICMGSPSAYIASNGVLADLEI